MKRRSTVIIAFLLTAALALGIGYAAYSTTLTINGTASVSAEAIKFTNDVIFTGATSDDPTFGTATVNDGGQSATFTVSGMTQATERVHFTYTISNNSTEAVNVKVTKMPTTTETNSKFTVTQSLLDTVEIAAGSSTTVVITVVLNETVTAAVDPVTYVIEYTAASVSST